MFLLDPMGGVMYVFIWAFENFRREISGTLKGEDFFDISIEYIFHDYGQE